MINLFIGFIIGFILMTIFINGQGENNVWNWIYYINYLFNFIKLFSMGLNNFCKEIDKIEKDAKSMYFTGRIKNEN